MTRIYEASRRAAERDGLLTDRLADRTLNAVSPEMFPTELPFGSDEAFAPEGADAESLFFERPAAVLEEPTPVPVPQPQPPRAAVRGEREETASGSAPAQRSASLRDGSVAVPAPPNPTTFPGGDVNKVAPRRIKPSSVDREGGLPPSGQPNAAELFAHLDAVLRGDE